MRPIDADTLKEQIPETREDIFENCRNCNLLDKDQILEIIDAAPTIEAEPIRHGHWEHGEDVFGMYYQCSECDMQYYGGYELNYCPECGAKMEPPKKRTEEQT